MTATAHATLDGTAASSARLSSVASGVLEFVWPMYLTLVFTLGAWVLIPTVVLGWQPVTIISGSMAPTVQPGHVVVIEPYVGQEVRAGTVLTYRDAEQDRLVTHRVAAVREDGTITTRGDANAVEDQEPLTTDRIVGVGRLVVPAAGLPALWAHQGRTDLLAVVVVLTVLATASAASAASNGVRTLRQWSSLRRGDPRHPRLRPAVLGAGVLVLTVLVAGVTVVSGASFVGADENPSNTFQAASVQPPANLRATCGPSGLLARSVHVDWDSAGVGVTYEVERSTSLIASYQLLGTTSELTWSDSVSSSLLSNTSYRVRTVAGSWKSEYRTLSLICL